MTPPNTETTVRLQLRSPFLQESNRWKSRFTKLSGEIPFKGIYESELTSKRYEGKLTGIFSLTMRPEDTIFIVLVSDLPEATVSDGEILKLIEICA